MAAMYYSQDIGEDLMWLCLSCTLVGAGVELVKFTYGHLVKIDYFSAI